MLLIFNSTEHEIQLLMKKIEMLKRRDFSFKHSDVVLVLLINDKYSNN